MTPRRCHIAAILSGLALVVALLCCVLTPQTVAALAGLGVVAGLLLREVES